MSWNSENGEPETSNQFLKLPKKDGLTRTSNAFSQRKASAIGWKWTPLLDGSAEKLLLTFNLSYCNFIFARLLDNKSANEVAKHLYAIKNDLHQKEMDFYEIFPVILTDNGGEFARVDDIEMDVRGESKLFFCDPNRSDQKGRIEKNHTLIRDILLKELALITWHRMTST